MCRGFQRTSEIFRGLQRFSEVSRDFQRFSEVLGPGAKNLREVGCPLMEPFNEINLGVHGTSW